MHAGTPPRGRAFHACRRTNLPSAMEDQVGPGMAAAGTRMVVMPAGSDGLKEAWSPELE